MKKILAVLMVLTLIAVLFAACSKNTQELAAETTTAEEDTAEEVTAEPEDADNETDGGLAGIANPMVEYGSLDEINEKAGTAIVHLPVQGVTDEQFFVTGEDMAEYLFVLNGAEFRIRAAAKTEDISGIYAGEGTIFEGSDDALITYKDEETHAARFVTEGVQYVIIAANNEFCEAENFESVVNEYFTIVTGK